MNRCVNLDWLEVDCCELGDPHTADWFRARGFIVREREYGTRVYYEMFTLEDREGNPFIEIRRNPKTPILDPSDTHLRLVNRACYLPDAAQCMAQFIQQYSYSFIRIARVDICLDFERFDRGDDPQAFLRRYMKGKFSKLNQANVHSHGTDTWNQREWNSISWGSPHSDIGTKFYNKTMELYDPTTKSYGKAYIRQAWAAAGLVDDYMLMTKTNAKGKLYTPQIWRVEFSIRSSVKKWFVIKVHGNEKDYQSIRNTLEMYDGRDRLLTMFASLSCHYFHFKYYEKNVRKDRCQDKVLFQWDKVQSLFKVEKSVVATDRKPDRWLLRLIGMLKTYRETTIDNRIRDAIDALIAKLQDDALRTELKPHALTDEIRALRAAFRLHDGTSPDAFHDLYKRILHMIKLNERDCPFF